MDAETLLKEFEYWGEHPDHPWKDWRDEVDDDDTRWGYWEWVAARMTE